MNNLTIIMYHYVRNLKNSKYPNINGINLKFFRNQLNFIQKNFNVINYQDIEHNLINKRKLPKKACWLTFDDGMSDHYKNVFPELRKRKLTAGFFPPAKAVEKRKMMDVHKIHILMASTKNEKIINEIKNYLNKSLFYKMWKKYAKKDSLNSIEEAFIKRLLQKGLDHSKRSKIISELFRKYVTKDERAFADDFYMNKKEIKEMISENMYFGSHGYNHLWLDNVNENTQQNEINKSLKFLKTIGSKTKNWAMCYPYGAFNLSLKKILNKKKCLIGITTENKKAFLNEKNRFNLPRIDTVFF